VTNDPLPPHIFLYGPPASGKTTLGRCLSAALDLPFIDLDELIEEQAGQRIPDIFAAEGEPGFRQREAAALAKAAAGQAGPPAAVIALGGGALLRPENRSLAETTGQVVCLRAAYTTILDRLPQGEGGRPLLSGDARQQLQALLAARAGHYASFPLQVVVDDLSPDTLAWQVQTRLGLFRVSGMGKDYDVRIVPHGLDCLGQALQARGLRGPLALVMDSNVAPLYAEQALAALRQAGYTVQPVVIPAGEPNKTLGILGELWAAFLAAGLERGSTVVALGGGVVGDLAGFAASAYLRGVAWVAVPSTLLAMVDASLGGKTGADLPQGKNLVGAFHPPALVLADPVLLQTLPDIELRNGLAEVVKHGILSDAALFDLCRQGWETVCSNRDEIVRRAVAVKVAIIQRDPYERGERASLNLGHTLGHALELVSGYGLRHGEAVAIGTLAAARLAERRGMAESGLPQVVGAALGDLGLPLYIPEGLDDVSIARGMGVDKKRSDGKVRLVLPVGIGRVRWGVSLDNPAELIACGRQP